MSSNYDVAADTEIAEGIRRLYGLNGIHEAQVQRSVLPALSRERTPDWENCLRMRLNAVDNQKP